jgi:hypothetical protein
MDKVNDKNLAVGRTSIRAFSPNLPLKKQKHLLGYYICREHLRQERKNLKIQISFNGTLLLKIKFFGRNQSTI